MSGFKIVKRQECSATGISPILPIHIAQHINADQVELSLGINLSGDVTQQVGYDILKARFDANQNKLNGTDHDATLESSPNHGSLDADDHVR